MTHSKNTLNSSLFRVSKMEVLYLNSPVKPSNLSCVLESLDRLLWPGFYGEFYFMRGLLHMAFKI